MLLANFFCLRLFFIEKQHRDLGIQARLFARLRDFYAQYRMPSEILRNHKIQLFCSFQ